MNTKNTTPNAAEIEKLAKVARILGGVAYLSGVARILAMDTKVAEILPMNNHAAFMKVGAAWYRGWDAANIAANSEAA